MSTESRIWISWRLSSGSISAASHPVPNVVAIPAIIIAIITNITRAPSFEEPQNFRNGTPQNFWNHQHRNPDRISGRQY
ncbi:MAG: hypothetical protein U0353_10985 [Sandaracinus sp.]